MTKKLNRAKCLNCGDILVSRHVHDWVACSCFSHNTGIFINGGNEYWRYGGNLSHLARFVNRQWVSVIDLLNVDEVEFGRIGIISWLRKVFRIG